MKQTSATFWEERYERMSEPSGGRPSQLLTRFVEGREIGRALDIGCARGDDAIWLARQGWDTTGVDIAEAALQAARKTAQEAGVSDRVRFERHDLGTTFPEGEFDLVSAMYFHSPIDFGRVNALKNATKATASGGLLLIAAHGSRAPWSWSGPDTVYPTAQEQLAELALTASHWREILVGPIEREATGPSGETAKVIDTVIAIERL